MNEPKILFLVQYPEIAPSPRYRVYQIVPWLQRNGIRCDVVPMLSQTEFIRSRKRGDSFWKTQAMIRAYVRRMKLASRVSDYDLVYILKGAFLYGPPRVERKIRRAGVPMIFDFDDAIHLHKGSQHNPMVDFLRSTNRIPETIRMVDQVVVPNQYLADYSSQHNDHVTVVAEAEDTDRFVARDPHQPSEQIVIGWIGSPSTAKYLKLIAPALRTVCQRFPHVVLRVVGGQFHDPEIRTELAEWSLDQEVALFHGLDIGIMPLPLEEWSKGKSGCKLRQYMASGVPGVATRIGYNCELVEHGKTGFLVETQNEWVESLSKLIEDHQLRNDIANAARNSVVERFSIPVIGPRLKEAIVQTIRRSSSPESAVS